MVPALRGSTRSLLKGSMGCLTLFPQFDNDKFIPSRGVAHNKATYSLLVGFQVFGRVAWGRGGTCWVVTYQSSLKLSLISMLYSASHFSFSVFKPDRFMTNVDTVQNLNSLLNHFCP